MKTSDQTTTIAPTGGSTHIPDLNMTFAEAMAKIAAMIEQDNKGDPEDFTLTDQWVDLRMEVLKAEPRSLSDVLAQLDLLLNSELEMDLPSFVDQALENIHALLKRWHEAGTASRPANDESLNPFAGAVAAFEAETEKQFAATVSAFDAAGETALTLPTDPSEAMVAAAVEATGCGREMVLKGFAAMVDARRREVA